MFQIELWSDVEWLGLQLDIQSAGECYCSFYSSSVRSLYD